MSRLRDTKKEEFIFDAQKQNPGAILREYRERKKIRLLDVSEATRIPVFQLEKIENDEFGNENEFVYLKGFVRNYSEYLGLDADKVVALFRRAVANKETVDLQKVKKKTNWYKNLSKIIDMKNANLFIILGILLLSIGVILYGVYLYNRPPVLIVYNPDSSSFSTDQSSIQLSGKTEKNVELQINNKSISIDESGEFSNTVELVEGINEILINSRKINNNKISERKYTVTYTKPIDSKPEVPIIFTERPVKLVINGAASWITLNIDGEQKVAQILNVGTYNYSMKEKLTLRTGKPESVSLSIDGKDYKMSKLADFNCNINNGEVQCSY